MALPDHIKKHFIQFITKSCILLLICSFNLLSPQKTEARAAQAILPTEHLSIHAQGNASLKIKKLDFCVEIADSPQEWQKGLMFRKSLRPNSGMLFLYPTLDIHTMWMKNTSIPLDMLFIDGTGTIIFIAENTTPFSHDVIGPSQPVKAVLELNAGTVKRLDIKPGYSVHHGAFGQKPRLVCRL